MNAIRPHASRRFRPLRVESLEARLLLAGAPWEAGENDFRISFREQNETTANQPAIAYNFDDREYLVVWQRAINDTAAMRLDQEIFAQRLDASGQLLGADFQISAMGGANDSLHHGRNPDVAYNPVSKEYLVVWEGDHDVAPLVDEEFEIFGQRVGRTGAPSGSMFRISDIGPAGNAAYDAFTPAVAVNALSGEYFVVWSGSIARSSGEFNIYGQRLTSAAAPTGADDFLISDVGTISDLRRDALAPSVAYGDFRNEYLVAWYADDGLDNDEFEIYGQRLAADGFALGTDDFRISDMGPDGDIRFNAFAPKVVYNPIGSSPIFLRPEYLVVWYGDDDTAGLVDNELEVFGQRLTDQGAETGTNDFRISQMGPDGNAAFQAFSPAVSYNRLTGQYLVVWAGDDHVGGHKDGDDELFGQRLSSAGAQVGPDDFRISDMGPEGQLGYSPQFPAVVYNRDSHEQLVVWSSFDTGLGAQEIFGQRLYGDGGLPDVVGRDAAGLWQLGHNTGAGLVNRFFGFWSPGANWRDVATADVDGKGRNEVVGRTATGEWWVGFNDGVNATNVFYGHWNEAAGWRDVHVGDLDGDGDTDILGRTSAGDWWAGLNNGARFVNTPFGLWNEAAGWNDVRLADFDLDGDLDVLGRTNTGAWWLGRYNGSAFVNAHFGQWAAIAWNDVGAADFTGDGFPDVIGRTPGGEWWVARNNAGAGFDTNLRFGQWAPIAWNDVHYADFTGDSLVDAIGRTDGGEWWVAANSGLNSFAGNLRFGQWAPIAWRDVQYADFDANGFFDALGRTPSGDWWLAPGFTGSDFAASRAFGQWDESRGWRDVFAGEFRPFIPGAASERSTSSAELALAAELSRQNEDDAPTTVDHALRDTVDWDWFTASSR